CLFFFFFQSPAPTELYTLSLHDALPISIVYLSSLGVYGDHAGAWIDETAPTIPPHTRGAARVDAELAWQALGRQRNTPVAILRLDRKSTRLNSSHVAISYAVFCLKKKN